jgi:hypothetical protein
VKRRTGIEPASSPWKGEALPLSYRRTNESLAEGGSPTVTVCTNDVALADLVEHGLPVAVAESLGDVEQLAATVVELEYQRIGLTAVLARMRAKELDHVPGSLECDAPLSTCRIGDVSSPVRGIVSLLVGSVARPAVVVALTLGSTSPRKRVQRFELTTAAASA